MGQPVDDLKRELTLAGRAAVKGGPVQAERHLSEGLVLLDDARGRQMLSRQSAKAARRCIDQAASLLRRGENNRALVALRSALESIDAT